MVKTVITYLKMLQLRVKDKNESFISLNYGLKK